MGDWCISAAAVLFAGLLAVYALYKLFVSKHKNLPPGPRGLQALRSVFRAMNEGSLHKLAGEWSEQYGELVLCQTVVGEFCFLNSARLVREMFDSKEREQLTNDKPKMFVGWYAVYGYKDLATEPHFSPEWSKKKRIFHQALKFYGEGADKLSGTVQTELRRLVTRIEDGAGEEMDMDELLAYSLLCVLIVQLTGENPDPDSTLPQRFRESDEAVNAMFGIDTILATFPFLRFIPGTRYRRICQTAIATRDAWMNEIFDKAKESHKPGQPRGTTDAFLDEQLKKDNQWLTDDHIRALLFDVIVAGYMPSLQTLRALFLCLAHNPEVTHKVQKEIDNAIGARPIGVEDRSQLPYAEAVVLETLRYSSVVPTGVPRYMKDDITLDGLTVPKGSLSIANAWTVHRDPKVWTEPQLFRPERFLDDVTGKLLPTTHPLRQSLVLFGVGKRSCPGETFARTRIFLYLTTLLQKFDILPPVKRELPPPDPDLYINGVVREPRPYSLIFRQRT